MQHFPDIFHLQQSLPGPELDDPAAVATAQLATLNLQERVRPGETVAITAGSRGIWEIGAILKAVVDYLKSIEAVPFLVPTMGSHGGGTADGQLGVLAGLGITEQSMGCPIRASMQTVMLDTAPQGFPIYFDRHAQQADHVLVCGRVKPHTNFNGRHQSGLAKMLLTGLGKHEGAKVYHRAFMDYSFDEIAEAIGPMIIERGKVVGGLAILENARGRTAQITGVAPTEFLERDQELLEQATQWMARLPFDRADLLIIDQMGKHISGTGMDTNVIGRKRYDHSAAPDETPKIRRIFVRSVLGGNATGIGMAEFCTKRSIEQADLEATRINSITSHHVTAGMLPIDFETDREAIGAALTTIGLTEPPDARVLWIKNTSSLEHLACSKAYLDEALGRDDLQVLSDPQPLPLDEDGNLPRTLPDAHP